jgi:hypothetical protein
MTDDELVGVFLYAQTRLRVDDSGLTADNTIADLNTVAKLCLDVKAITAAGDTPFQLALNRLAALTESVLVTLAIPDPQAVRAWLVARGELLELRIPRN